MLVQRKQPTEKKSAPSAPTAKAIEEAALDQMPVNAMASMFVPAPVASATPAFIHLPEFAPATPVFVRPPASVPATPAFVRPPAFVPATPAFVRPPAFVPNAPVFVSSRSASAPTLASIAVPNTTSMPLIKANVIADKKTAASAIRFELENAPPLVVAIHNLHAMSPAERAKTDVDALLNAADSKQKNRHEKFPAGNDGKSAFQWAAHYKLSTVLPWFFTFFKRNKPTQIDILCALELLLKHSDIDPYTDEKQDNNSHENAELRQCIRFLLTKLEHSFILKKEHDDKDFIPSDEVESLDYKDSEQVTCHLLRTALKHKQLFFIHYYINKYVLPLIEERNDILCNISSGKYYDSAGQPYNCKDWHYSFIPSHIKLLLALLRIPQAGFLADLIHANCARAKSYNPSSYDFEAILPIVAQAIYENDEPRLKRLLTISKKHFSISYSIPIQLYISLLVKIIQSYSKSSFEDITLKQFPLLAEVATYFLTEINPNYGNSVFSLSQYQSRDDKYWRSLKAIPAPPMFIPFINLLKDLFHDTMKFEESNFYIKNVLKILKELNDTKNQLFYLKFLNSEWMTGFYNCVTQTREISSHYFKTGISPEVELELVKKLTQTQLCSLFLLPIRNSPFSQAAHDYFGAVQTTSNFNLKDSGMYLARLTPEYRAALDMLIKDKDQITFISEQAKTLQADQKQNPAPPAANPGSKLLKAEISSCESLDVKSQPCPPGGLKPAEKMAVIIEEEGGGTVLQLVTNRNALFTKKHACINLKTGADVFRARAKELMETAARLTAQAGVFDAASAADSEDAAAQTLVLSTADYCKLPKEEQERIVYRPS